MRALFLALLLCLISVTAHAQHIQVVGTPTAVIHDNVTGTDVTVGVWAENTPIGDTIVLAEKSGAQWLGIYSSFPTSNHFPDSVLTAAGAAAYVATFLTAINGAIQNRFALPSSGPKPVGLANLDAVNQALYAAFKFKVMPDGTTAFVAD